MFVINIHEDRTAKILLGEHSWKETSESDNILIRSEFSIQA